MDAACSNGDGLDALAALKLESLAVEAAFLAQGSVYLLLLAMGLEYAPDSALAFASMDQSCDLAFGLLLWLGFVGGNRRNADNDINETEAKDAEENGNVDDDGGSEGEDSEDITEDDEEDDSDVNGKEGSDEDEDEDEDDKSDEDEDDEEDEDDDEEDQRPQKKKK